MVRREQTDFMDGCVALSEDGETSSPPRNHMLLTLDVLHDLEFIGCGSANAVFAYWGDRDDLKHKIIRVRLLHSEICTTVIYNALVSGKFDSLRSYLVACSILQVDPILLQKLEDFGRKKVANFNLNLEEKYVLLMDNIFSYPLSRYNCYRLSKYHTFFVEKGNNETILEFKPKWLYILPENHKSCRNCLNAMYKGQKFNPCHLKLLQKNGIDIWCNEVQQELNRRGINKSVKNDLRETIQRNYNLFETLYALQNKSDVHKLLLNLKSEEDVTEELKFEMTIRDVSLLMKLNDKKVFVIDLDEKPATKWIRWKEHEAEFEDKYSEDLGLQCSFEANN